MRTYFLVVLFTATLIGSANSVQARSGDDEYGRWSQASHRHGGPGRAFGDPMRFVERMARRLDLDDVQEQTIANAVEAAKPEIEALRERARANRSAIRDLDVASADYGASLDALSLEQGQLATERTMLLGRLRADVVSVLTDEQRAELGELMERAKERRQRRFRRFVEDAEDL